jgi:ankyrin repeat protein
MVPTEDMPQSGARADVNARDEQGLTALHVAAGRGDAAGVRALLAAGADPLALDSAIGASPLHHAAQSGSVEVMRLLLEAGAPVDLQAPTQGMTPLMVAVWHRRPAVVAFLLDVPEINVAATNILGLTPAGVVGLGSAGAADPAHGIDDEIRSLFDAYAQRRAARLSAQPLFTTLVDGDLTADEKLARVRALVAEGADVNTVSPVMGSGRDGHTPLHVAALDGHAEIVRLLLEAGADQTIEDHYMRAVPAHKAASFGHAGALRALTAHSSFGLVADAQGPFNGYTPLHDAVWHGHTEATAVLLAAGVRTDIAGHDGRTPLDLARDSGYDDIVALLG